MPSDLNLIKKTRMHTRARPRTRSQKQAADGNQATRPVSRERERGRGPARHGRRDQEGEGSETKKGEAGQGRQRSEEIRRERGKRERWEQALSWCSFSWGPVCVVEWRPFYTACKPALLWGWTVRTGEIRGEEKRIIEKQQVRSKEEPVAARLCTLLPLQQLVPSAAGQARQGISLMLMEPEESSHVWGPLGCLSRHTPTRLEVVSRSKAAWNPSQQELRCLGNTCNNNRVLLLLEASNQISHSGVLELQNKWLD